MNATREAMLAYPLGRVRPHRRSCLLTILVRLRSIAEMASLGAAPAAHALAAAKARGRDEPALARGEPRRRTLDAAPGSHPRPCDRAAEPTPFRRLAAGAHGRRHPHRDRGWFGARAAAHLRVCSGDRGLPDRARLHPDDPQRDHPRLAAVRGRRTFGCLRQHRSWLAAGAKPGAARNDGDLGLISRRRDRHDADGRRLRSRRAARCVHAIFARRAGCRHCLRGGKDLGWPSRAPGQAIPHSSPPSHGGH